MKKAKRLKTARAKPAGNASDHQTGSCSLLALPVEVLRLVLDLLGPDELKKLLRTSKAMALPVMQHRAGRLTFILELHKGVKSTAMKQLEWAPPSSLKLQLDGLLWWYSGTEVYDWRGVLDALHTTYPVPDNHQGQHPQQFPSISEVCFEGFVLPDLVPPGLTAMFPNMHTLKLNNCTMQDGKWVTSSKSSSGAWPCATSTSTATGANTPAPNLHTLVLEGTHAPCLAELPAGQVRLTRSQQAAVRYMEQLRSSLTNLKCMQLVTVYDGDENLLQGCTKLVQLFESQLEELLVTDVRMTPSLHWQQLRMLEASETIVTEADTKTLLSLPSLTHLEVCRCVQSRDRKPHGLVKTIRRVRVCLVCGDFSEDYSSYPCKWQSLQLHMTYDWQDMDTLARLPLHSLTQPLRLGCQRCSAVTLRLPKDSDEESFCTRLGRLAQHLNKCGVQLLSRQLTWSCDSSWDFGALDDQLPPGALHADAIAMIAPAIGPHAHVSLADFTIDKAILEAVATVYEPSLEQLQLEGCAFVANMRPAWHAALQGLPALNELELKECVYDDFGDMDDLGDENAEMARIVYELAAAMSEQPEGRSIDVVCRSDVMYCSAGELVEDVVAAGERLVGVEVKSQGSYTTDEYDYLTCVRITRKHTDQLQT